MSNFKDSPYYSDHNDYYTPKYAWAHIKHLIEKKGFTTIYEAFMLNSNEQSKKYLQELGFNVVGDKTIDFLTNDLDTNSYDIIVSNPPFQRISSFKKRKTYLKYKIFKKLFDLDKPFIIIMNSTNIFSKWFKELAEGHDVKFIFPSRKIQFDKYDIGGVDKLPTDNNCSFNAIYMTYKILDKNEWV